MSKTEAEVHSDFIHTQLKLAEEELDAFVASSSDDREKAMEAIAKVRFLKATFAAAVEAVDRERGTQRPKTIKINPIMLRDGLGLAEAFRANAMSNQMQEYINNKGIDGLTKATMELQRVYDTLKNMHWAPGTDMHAVLRGALRSFRTWFWNTI